MKYRKWKKGICVFLALLMLLPLGNAAVFAEDAAFKYPSGVSAQSAAAAVVPTDRLVENACKSFTGKTLRSLLGTTLYSGDTLSGLLVSVYTGLSENADQMKTIGVDISPQAVASGLSAYPKVQSRLEKAADWQSVELSGVSWGKSVTAKPGFARAFSACLHPLWDALYMLLCSGSMKVSLITVKGADGYENAVKPILQSLGCSALLSQADFTAAADKDRSKMLENILLPVFGVLEKGLDAPASTLTAVLPQFAYFEESGQLQECFDKLLKPITDNTLVKIAVFLKLFSLDSMKLDLEKSLNDMLSGFGKQQGLTFPEIDFSTLAACGTPAAGGYTPDRGQAYVVILRWLFSTLSKNAAALPKLMKGMAGGSQAAAISPALLSSFGKIEPDALVALFVSLFTPQKIGAAKPYTFASVTPETVTYPANLSEKNMKTVLEGVDELLDEFAAEYSDYDSVYGLLSGMLYTNANVNTLTVTVYSYLEKQGLSGALKLMGVDVTPKGLASKLTESGYAEAKGVLQKASSWSKVKLSGVTWNFRDGRRTGFENALIAVLRPLFPLLRMVLAGENLTVLESVTFSGADGYNTAVIPLLEAFGCKASDIRSYESYRKNASTDAVVGMITEPVFSLLDRLMEKPVDTLTALLPNLVHTLDGSFLTDCLTNLLRPVTALTKQLSAVYTMDTDFTALTKKLNTQELLSGVVKSAGLTLPKLELSRLASLGEAKTRKSKEVSQGKRVSYTYIVADQPAVLVTVLRALVDTLKLPENSKKLSALTGGTGEAAANPFASYSSGILDQFATMTTDETIEWLYNLLFRERPKATAEQTDPYTPSFLYVKEQKNHTAAILIGIVLGVAAVSGIVLYANRGRLFYEQPKKKKKQKKSRLTGANGNADS